MLQLCSYTTSLAAIILTLATNLANAQERVQSLVGTWRGSYVCAQGSTGLNLTINSQSEGNFSGYFHFFPQRKNLLAKEGCYTVSGHIDEQNYVIIEAGRWITRPEGYVTVGLDGSLEVLSKSLAGKVVAPYILGTSCKTFRLKLRSLRPDVDSLCQGADLQAQVTR